MKLRRLRALVLPASCVCLLFLLSSSQAFGSTLIYNFDENGDGTLTGLVTNPAPLPASLRVDPLSGLTTLFYDLLIGTDAFVGGDVRLHDPNATSTVEDILRFDPNMGGVFVFSQTGGGSLADVGIPTFTTPVIDFAEANLGGGLSGISYTPINAQQPGFDTNPVFGDVSTYNFVSDTPEPATYFLISGALLAMAFFQRRKYLHAGRA
jgi:hypothetical protein